MPTSASSRSWPSPSPRSSPWRRLDGRRPRDPPPTHPQREGESHAHRRHRRIRQARSARRPAPAGPRPRRRQPRCRRRALDRAGSRSISPTTARSSTRSAGCRASSQPAEAVVHLGGDPRARPALRRRDVPQQHPGDLQRLPRRGAARHPHHRRRVERDGARAAVRHAAALRPGRRGVCRPPRVGLLPRQAPRGDDGRSSCAGGIPT